jgi:hypothetical protein
VNNKVVKYSQKSTEPFVMKRMETLKADGYIKKGTFTNEVVWGKYSYIFSILDKKKQKAFKQGMFLFGMVRKDSKAYLKKNKNIKLPTKYNQIEYYNGYLNEDMFGKVTGTDLNHAYWRIAFNLGIISDMTYLKGLDDKFKSVRLAALSTLGADKKYKIIKAGKITDELKIIKGDESLQLIYKLIRYTCYKYMAQVKKQLKSDFLCYKTDAIYYIDTKENRKIVRDFFKEKDLLMKQLE